MNKEYDPDEEYKIEQGLVDMLKEVNDETFAIIYDENYMTCSLVATRVRFDYEMNKRIFRMLLK